MNSQVDVIITTYKRKPEVLKRAVKSVLEQSFQNFKIFIIDDSPAEYAGREETVSLINALNDNRITYSQNDTNIGACASRNRGAEMGEGEYIAFLDDDDVWLPNKIEEQIKRFTSKSIAMVYCDYFQYFTDKDKMRQHYLKSTPPSGMIFKAFLSNNVAGSCSFPMLRRSAFKEVGGFDPTMPALQDWELWLRISKKYEVAYVSQPLAKYYFYEGERISAHPERRVIAFERILNEFNTDYAVNKNEKAAYYLMGVKFYSFDKNLKKAIQFWIDAIRLNPLNIKNNLIAGVKMVGRQFYNSKTP